MLDRGRLRSELGLPESAFIVGFTGNLIPRKGLDVLIRAAATVAKTRPHVHFVAMGRVPVGNAVNYLAEYEQLAREVGLADVFHFVGFRKDVRGGVGDFDTLILPSRQEPFGRSIIEAMALGTPVIASEVGGIPEIIRHGEHGLLVPPDDPEALASAISRIVDDEPLRKSLAQAALERVRNEFDVAVLTKRIEALILSAATGRRLEAVEPALEL